MLKAFVRSAIGFIGGLGGTAETASESTPATLRTDSKFALWVRDWMSAPARSGKAVTPDDDTDLPDGPCRAVYLGVAGDVVVIFADDDTAVTMTAAAAGEHPWALKRIKSTSTNATNIVALY